MNQSTEPKVSIGIMTASEVSVTFLSPYISPDGSEITGRHTFSYSPGTDTVFTPLSATGEFEIDDVTIGINFHWERQERQRFAGSLRLVVANGSLTVINIIDAEAYLRSVISSEMSATSSEELLKAHAVISRSWLMARIAETRHLADVATPGTDDPESDNADEVVRWYDSNSHDLFDVCADDHCQRYQGTTRVTTPTVDQAIEATRGLVLMSGGKLCDARFSKCCGGVMEQFENCWEPEPHPYLVARRDSPHPNDFPDLTVECNAEEWILGQPAAYCNTDDAGILSQVLNDYDRETAHFYRWKVEYTREEIAAIIRDRSGIDFGEIVDLVPVARGTSGRLYKLEITGTLRSVTVGKELEIRRWLSRSHLYSSAFVVERINPDERGVPERFILHGAGWGHGVGLCQIGAAVMSAQGHDFASILSHYYPGSSLTRLY